MAWTLQEIEVALEKNLKRKFKHSPAEATKYFGYYTYARDTLISEKIFDAVGSLKKDLSDHGQDHIMNVLANAGKLLGKEVDKMDAIQLYFICMTVLFHDVGNLIANRETHHQHNIIREIYDYVRNKAKEFSDERMLVPEVASKHSGTAGDGSKDTIKELHEETPYLFETPIHTKMTAALLRLADEMAEGYHRTSIYMNKYYNYPYAENSKIYHKYGEIARPFIDRKGKRIGITYYFTLCAKDGIITEESHNDFIELYSFTIRRMLKIEAERKYCKYYCEWLSPFNKTDITFNYFVDNDTNGEIKSKQVRLDNAQLVLNDLVLPIDETLEKFFKEKSSYEPENVFNSIKSAFDEK
ncbi:MAG: hypothetical protein JWR61_3387 [Ferruginibacter sp.]|uniref:HD domain-containing protein n=1 Tax=Ferruginibacter sp. TaxID=1940288 RepID=UPI002659C8CF|nr:hypothetical protein [Ferruginibacter sp.]MDB5278432.1 hypothetical protein [Ferruginibacter sp.]